MSDHNSSLTVESVQDSASIQAQQPWHTFEGILRRLHQEGIYIDADQLAEFLLSHGLPVQLRHVPAHLTQRAIAINQNYRGDMAQLIEETEPIEAQF
jgi:hypothetical protein